VPLFSDVYNNAKGLSEAIDLHSRCSSVTCTINQKGYQKPYIYIRVVVQ
jgi:hypothetical protein